MQIQRGQRGDLSFEAVAADTLMSVNVHIASGDSKGETIAIKLLRNMIIFSCGLLHEDYIKELESVDEEDFEGMLFLMAQKVQEVGLTPYEFRGSSMSSALKGFRGDFKKATKVHK